MRSMGDPSAPDWPNAAAKAYDQISMTEFLKEQRASHGAIELLEYPFQSAEDDPVSFLYNLREFWHNSQSTIRYKIAGGNDLLPKAFAAKFEEKVHYGSPVVRIEQDSNTFMWLRSLPLRHAALIAVHPASSLAISIMCSPAKCTRPSGRSIPTHIVVNCPGACREVAPPAHGSAGQTLETAPSKLSSSPGCTFSISWETNSNRLSSDIAPMRCPRPTNMRETSKPLVPG